MYMHSYSTTYYIRTVFRSYSIIYYFTEDNGYTYEGKVENSRAKAEMALQLK